MNYQFTYGYTNDILNIFTGHSNIRCVDINGYMWFVAQDVAEELGYHGAYEMCRLLPDPSMVQPHSMRLQYKDGRIHSQEMLVISEPALDFIVMHSTKPDARLFQAEVLRIIHQVRHTGFYGTDSVQASLAQDPRNTGALLGKDMRVFSTENLNPNNPYAILQQKYDRSQQDLRRERLFRTVSEKLYQADLNQATTLVNAAEAMIGNLPGTIDIGELAKLIWNTNPTAGRNKLMQVLRQDGYLMKLAVGNIPTQISLADNLMILIEANGYPKAMITPKGQVYFINKYKDVPLDQ